MGIPKVSGEVLYPKVSVCIPVYNRDDSLASCLDSVENQTLTDIEIICVDDASTDNSGVILKKYADRDCRIRIIKHEKNLGTLVSRKDAVLAAQGKYIMFIDSDDEFFPHACATALSIIDKNKTDMVEFGVRSLDPSGNVKKINSLITEDIDRLEDCNLLHLKMKGTLKNWQSWNKIYRSDILKKAFYEMENDYSVLADDFRIFCFFGYYAQSVSFIREELYKWKWGYGIWTGISPVISLEKYKKLLTEKDDLDAVVKFINAKADREEYRQFLEEMRIVFLHQTISWWNNNLEEKEKQEGFRLFIEKWGTEVTAEALLWLLNRYTTKEKQLEKLQKENKKLLKEKDDLLKKKVELEKIENSNGYAKKELQRIKKQAANLSRDLKNVKNGWSYKIGRKITWLPRKLRDWSRRSKQYCGKLLKEESAIEPYAFIRVKNEAITLKASLNSILPVIKKGVIAYNECTDGSDLIIQDFCKRNPGFIPFQYPYHVVESNSPDYATEKIPYENTLAAYYNAALAFIPQNSWLIKIDCDEIYFPDILKESFSLPKNSFEVVVYSRLDLVRCNNSVKVIEYKRPWDHWLICNNNLKFINRHGYSKNGEYYAWELLVMPKEYKILYKPECSSFHFPAEKGYRKYTFNEEKLMSLEQFRKIADPKEISPALLEDKVINKIISSFEY